MTNQTECSDSLIFENHPAYKFARLQKGLSKDRAGYFANYSNLWFNFKTREFSYPLEVLYADFRRAENAF